MKKYFRILTALSIVVLFGMSCQLSYLVGSDANPSDNPEAENSDVPTEVAIAPVVTSEPTLVVATPILPSESGTTAASKPKPTMTPTFNSKVTPTSTPKGAVAKMTPTPVKSFTSKQLLVPAIPAPQPCKNPNAKITFPGEDRSISGVIDILGTANRSDLKTWKVEYRPDSTTLFTQLNQSTKAVTNSVLAHWATQSLANGTYWLRLSVLGQEHIFVAPCQIRFKIAN